MIIKLAKQRDEQKIPMGSTIVRNAIGGGFLGILGAAGLHAMAHKPVTNVDMLSGMGMLGAGVGAVRGFMKAEKHNVNVDNKRALHIAEGVKE